MQTTSPDGGPGGQGVKTGQQYVLEAVLAAAVAALALGVAGQVPVWFCVACPAVLGLLAPLLFNFAFGELADAACVRFNLPQDACNELWCDLRYSLAPAVCVGACARVGGWVTRGGVQGGKDGRKERLNSFPHANLPLDMSYSGS